MNYFSVLEAALSRDPARITGLSALTGRMTLDCRMRLVAEEELYPCIQFRLRVRRRQCLLDGEPDPVISGMANRQSDKCYQNQQTL